MIPKNLALVDDDTEYAAYLADHLVDRGIRVEIFPDSAALLTHPQAFDFEFYVIDLMLPGIDGVELIKVLRRRSQAGLLVVSGRLAPTVFDEVITAGADMYLAKPVKLNQVVLAIEAVRRRISASLGTRDAWRLDLRARQLVAPDGVRIDLTESDLSVLECFVEAAGAAVSRESLRSKLGRQSSSEANDPLNSTIYRLRRKIERATPDIVPLQSISRVGYTFRAALTVV